MKRLLNKLLASCVALTGAGGLAHSQDLRPLSGTLPPLPPDPWRGFYAGAHGGRADPKNDALATLTVVTVSAEKDEPETRTQRNEAVGFAGRRFFFGGGQLGYNVVYGPWVYGLETDVSSGNNRRSYGSFALNLGSSVIHSAGVDWFGTARVRAGFLFDPLSLVYATGGVAYGDVNEALTTTVVVRAGKKGTPTLTTASYDGSRFATGWVAGAGFERKLPDHRWSIKAEFLYLALDSGNVSSATTITSTNLEKGSVSTVSTTSQTSGGLNGMSVVRVGLNFRFWE